ncbi:hypothetical protein [Gryllotalpicola protaetiae]|uniref:Uncharacterized protein n=1 Tax=Gryllotalpicola protaetiae TaxID=2419771 RepID=A0A387BMX0_9MICO|nr:hypothetical protein [Gryllotalpicola protaetiae]AYG02356.1 hypothetical protein D7I44_01620 [Gryllotalpicola protaetiae]
MPIDPDGIRRASLDYLAADGLFDRDRALQAMASLGIAMGDRDTDTNDNAELVERINDAIASLEVARENGDSIDELIDHLIDYATRYENERTD